MPRAFTAAQINELKKQGSFSFITLLDLELRDGTNYYFSDFEGVFAKKLGVAGSVAYKPYLKYAGPFRISKNLRTDAGDIVISNLPGNTIDREVGAAMKAREFEGAMAIVRYYSTVLDLSMIEFHGTLGEQRGNDSEASFRLLQLLDTNILDAPIDVYSEACTWRFKSRQCGSTGSAASCPKDFASCKDATRAASERFNGIPMVPPSMAEVWEFEQNPNYKAGLENYDIPVMYSAKRTAELGGYMALGWGKARGKGNT
jgi:hypothetical protein